MITHVFATVPAGRLVPIPASEASAAGGAVLLCAPGKLYCLPWTTYTRRRINGGDLVLCNSGGTAVKDAAAASAPASTKLAPDGTVDTDQRSDAEINAAAAKASAAPTPTPTPTGKDS